VNKLDQQFVEDRALRDAAKQNVLADIELLKSGWNERGLTKRITSRIGGGAVDVFERASDTADDNRGVLVALIGAVVLWFASGALLELFGEASDVGDARDTIEDTDEHSAPEAGRSDLDNKTTLNTELEPAPPGDEND